MYQNKTGRIIRCPECFAKDIDVFLLYDDECDEFYCYKCCFSGSLEKVKQHTTDFIKKKYVVKRYFAEDQSEQ